MIPSDVAAIATLICAHWHELDNEAGREVLAAAWRIYEAIYPAHQAECTENFHHGWEAAIDEAATLLESDEGAAAGKIAPFVRALAIRPNAAEAGR